MRHGKCWTCGAPIASRTRGIPTIDTCENGHMHDSTLTLRGKMEAEVARLRKANEDLREALRKISIGEGWAALIASDALGDGDKGREK